MAYNESSDSEFDQEMERVLREHFSAETPDLRAPNDPWPWLESRLEVPMPPSFFSRLLGFLNPMKQGNLSPGFAIAGVAVAAIAIAAVVWAVSGNGGESPAGIAAVPATEAPTGGPLPTALPASTLAPESTIRRFEQRSLDQEDNSGPADSQAPATPAGSQGEVSAVPQVTATPAPASTAMVAEMEEREVEVTRIAERVVEVEREAPAATTAPAPTAAPQAAADSAQESSQAQARGPRGPAGPQGPAGSAGAAGPAGAAGGTPPDTTFRDYQRQPFVAAEDDNVSTFSLDTDRTSFQLALNWARSGYEVHPDSVRAEEWLNTFNYGYNLPSRTDSFALRSDLYPHPLDEGKRLARIAFQAPELVDDRPLNVTLVLDASGSMADGNRVDIARQAAESIRQSLRSDDRIAVVHFTENVIDRYTVEHSPPQDRRVRDSIAWLQPHGSTNVQAGLDLGVRLADEARERRPDAYNYVILMSDGVANVDATNPFAILETAYDPDTRNPLRLITIGVGINNYNDPLLEQLAQHGNGWYRYLDSTGQAQATFSRDNWLALSIPFADQTRAKVTWNAGTVERWRIIGYENRVTADENFTQDRKEFAEIYSGAATTVLYELELTDSASALAYVPLGRVELRWVDPDTGDSWSQTATLGGYPGAGFVGHNGSLAQFGAIVALTADLYGALPNYPESTYPEVHSGLSSLRSQLDALRGNLGSLDAYNDFAFLLDHITSGMEEWLPPSTPSGYSR